MKKSFIAFALIVAMLSLSTTAYAENETSATMTVNYEFTVPEPPDPPPTSTYVVNIPSSITNDSMELVEIKVTENTLPAEASDLPGRTLRAHKSGHGLLWINRLALEGCAVEQLLEGFHVLRIRIHVICHLMLAGENDIK
jgi:hypothetical protein